MAFTYTLTKVNKLGQFDETYGQRYWAEIKEELRPVMFNSKSQNIVEGDKLTCEETLNKRSNKGVDYLQLKKVQLDSVPQTSITPSSITIEERLERMERKIDQLLGIDEGLKQEQPKTGRESASWQQARERLQGNSQPVDELGNADMDEMPADFLDFPE